MESFMGNSLYSIENKMVDINEFLTKVGDVNSPLKAFFSYF